MQSDILLSQQEKDNYSYLLLTTFFYLKRNNFNETAANIFSEGNLLNLFKFPQEIQDGKTPSEVLQKKFILSFYSNTFFNSQESFDIISYFWDPFWELLAKKIKKPNQAISPIDKYLEREKKILTMTCKC